MSKFANLMFVTTLLIAFAPVSAQEAGEIQDATIAAPGAHAVEFENDHVRVISAIASAGHKSPMHSHPPIVVVSMDTARIKVTNADGSQAIVNFRPGTVLWLDETAHEWELLAGEINVIAVEVKAAAEGAPAATETEADAAAETPVAEDGIQDATVAAPGAHSVEFENDHVRVISGIASAGHKSPMHSHPPMVVIFFDTARAKLTNSDGSEAIVNVRPGTVFWGDAGAHEWELLAGEIDAIAVEIKAAAKAGMAEASAEGTS